MTRPAPPRPGLGDQRDFSPLVQAYFGYAPDEMASLLGTSEAAIANRLLRARKALGEAAKAPEQVRVAVVLPLMRRAP